MSGEQKLEVLLQTMHPVLNQGDYVFASVKELTGIDREHIVCLFREKEGTTIVVEKHIADQFNLNYDFIASWITLEVHSSLEAVGLTAAFSTALTTHNISCNVISGYYHDHIFVHKKDANTAIEVLEKLSEIHRTKST